jgi:hypothetical protein
MLRCRTSTFASNSILGFGVLGFALVAPSPLGCMFLEKVIVSSDWYLSLTPQINKKKSTLQRTPQKLFLRCLLAGRGRRSS